MHDEHLTSAQIAVHHFEFAKGEVHYQPTFSHMSAGAEGHVSAAISLHMLTRAYKLTVAVIL